jgi:two-component sensor histidine kinase
VPSTRRPTSWARVHAARDITDRKRPEETQRLLLRDLNHRVKNTLTNAQAICATKMLRRTKDPAEFAASFSGRIQSLSRLPHALSSATWKGVDSRDLVRDQLTAQAVDETKVTAWGPPVHLEAQLALHPALVLHELGTNAIKYGALSTTKVVVTISWSVANAMHCMRWGGTGRETSHSIAGHFIEIAGTTGTLAACIAPK